MSQPVFVEPITKPLTTPDKMRDAVNQLVASKDGSGLNAILVKLVNLTAETIDKTILYHANPEKLQEDIAKGVVELEGSGVSKLCDPDSAPLGPTRTSADPVTEGLRNLGFVIEYKWGVPTEQQLAILRECGFTVDVVNDNHRFMVAFAV